MKKIGKINALILTGMLSMPIYAEEIIAEAEKITIEAGIGVNYGGLIGVTASKPINAKIELFAGLGISGNKTGYTVGGRYYIDDSIRLIANYGTNALIETEKFYRETDYEIFEGLNFGVGYLVNNRWSIDLMYIDASKADDRIEELKREGYVLSGQSSEKVKLSLGYRW
ncbi:hypothetical protein [Bathymodiolus thermophilus thioautotrophic gill symbiont]|uniref:Outer membrane protein beta-barrel domain-containing protein n=1 Tax=Bathymodiolus thermophilus thioautotrophic gill symbiont TaxID=2360 RepID=A0A8H8XDY7_9GAMM|nr:hypothetical protein [Bathymodiolus thermophilus thioautotrophic gill symbiont]CAB5497410.1 hypothetical protein THERMOS_666 [Bathymodiolus thermophilus thioautotrophic gill symbiont]